MSSESGAPFTIDRNEKLGKGGYGVVFKGTYGLDRVPVAIKRIPREDDRERELVPLKREFTHENVVRYFAIWEDVDFVYFIMELCAGTLKDLVEKKYTEPSPGNMEEMMLQVTCGLQYLHSQRIAHRDLKPGNILISQPIGKSPPKMRLADFGLCREVRPDEDSSDMLLSGAVGTEGWKPREWQIRLSKEGRAMKYGYSADIFSLGCVFGYAFTNGCHPFGADRYQRVPNILDGIIDWKDETVISDNSLRQLIRSMIQKEKENRPKIKDILNYFYNRRSPEVSLNAGDSTNLEKQQIESETRLTPIEQSNKPEIVVDYAQKLRLTTQVGLVYSGSFGDTPATIRRIPYDEWPDNLNLREDLKHDNVVQYYGFLKNVDFVYLAMEPFDQTLVDFILRGRHKTSNFRGIAMTIMMSQVTCGLQYLHSQHIVHRNLRPENILILNANSDLSPRPIVKIDYSEIVSAIVEQEHGYELSASATKLREDGWRAPELLDRSFDPIGRFTFACDIFSLGCVFGYAFTGGSHPFGVIRRLSNILEGKCDWKDEKKISDGNLRELIKRMIKKDPEKRPNCDEILAHPAFATEDN